jgi:hypothetical protein
MNKQFCFLVSLPRAGNTLLGSLLNQNHNICLTGNSILSDVLWELNLLKESKIFKNFPDVQSYSNITNNVFKNYYKGFAASTIIDRGMWGSPANLEQINTNVTNNPKFIVLYRPVRECLASFVKANESLNVSEEYIMDYYLHDEGMLGRSLLSMKNLMNQHEDSFFIPDWDKDRYFITHKRPSNKPEQTIKKICEFLGEKYIPIRTKNLEQLSINGVNYDDSVLRVPLHKVNNTVVYQQIDVEKYLSQQSIQKANDLDNIDSLFQTKTRNNA